VLNEPALLPVFENELLLLVLLKLLLLLFNTPESIIRLALRWAFSTWFMCGSLSEK
jgi:hypothetical protein